METKGISFDDGDRQTMFAETPWEESTKHRVGTDRPPMLFPVAAGNKPRSTENGFPTAAWKLARLWVDCLAGGACVRQTLGYSAQTPSGSVHQAPIAATRFEWL